ncbi:hypothetical protein L3Y34_011800 [Caenorhabditis briggsae]|nr:hypothetical protein L3Y34_011799 [Caenorhabditis briggsae]ULT82078.1 hypothetical protein L3Y34_011800 [Caenorhabditis briggsae]
MPIRLLSLPAKDLQYCVNLMNVGDLIAFSLCSKQTKNLVKSSNLEEIRTTARFGENDCIEFEILACQRRFNREIHKQITFYLHKNQWMRVDRGNGKEQWKFTRSYCIAHLMSILKTSMITYLDLIDLHQIPYLNTVKQIFPKFYALSIGRDCSDELTKMAILKLGPIAEEVEVNKIPVINDISQFLTLNLNFLLFKDEQRPLKLKLSDLLILNVRSIASVNTDITERELNRFLKLWMKGNHSFYCPENIELISNNAFKMDQVFKGIQYETVLEDHSFRLKRGDGKELRIITAGNIMFQFS